MFGRQDSPAQDAAQIPDQSIDNALGDEQSQNNNSWQHPGAPLDTAQSMATDMPAALPAPTDDTPTDQPQNQSQDQTQDQTQDQPSDQPSAPSSDQPADNQSDMLHPQDVSSNDLIDIKQQALGQLGPLVGHLDQSPEEKFRTTMMMIQASDDQSLVRAAYEAAQQIQDEKTRAQALLDIINEINYFTQHNQ